MYKKILFITCLFTTLTFHAQLKTFSLDEAVMQQARAFKADKLSGFQWIPNTTNYVFYTDGNSKMMQATSTNANAKELDENLFESINSQAMRTKNDFTESLRAAAGIN
jgi:dipeptidyl-peptidase-4